jgi:hypothetical protein
MTLLLLLGAAAKTTEQNTVQSLFKHGFRRLTLPTTHRK